VENNSAAVIRFFSSLLEGPVAHLLAQPLVAGLTDPKHYAAFMILEYDISQQKTQSEVGPEPRRWSFSTWCRLHENQSPGTPASARAKIDWNWPRTRPRYAWPAAGPAGSASDLVTAPSRAMGVPAPADFNDR